MYLYNNESLKPLILMMMTILLRNPRVKIRDAKKGAV